MTITTKETILPTVAKFLATLHESELVYCHWKSNDCLHEALMGSGDLDILFDNKDIDTIRKVAEANGFIEFTTAPCQSYPFIHDFIAIDPSQGRIIHIHAHFQLTIGEARVKSYIAPWASHVLNNRVFDQVLGVYHAHPCDEAIMLIVRAALKTQALPLTIFWRRKLNKNELSQASRELNYLLAQTSLPEILERAPIFLGESSVTALQEVCLNGLSVSLLNSFLNDVHVEAHKWRRHGPWKQLIKIYLHDAIHFMLRINRKLELFDIPMRRTLPKEGIVVAIVGVDGTGKSSQARDVTKELRKKIDVAHVYMGTGKGQANLIRKPLIIFRNWIGQKQRGTLFPIGKMPANQNNKPNNQRNFARRIWIIIWAASVLIERWQKIKRVVTAKKRGFVVVCDRYPQNTVAGYNDGPLLNDPGACKKKCSLLSRLESNFYKTLEVSYPPDLVIRLYAEPDIIKSRRPEMTVSEIRKKQNDIMSVDFHSSTLNICSDNSFPQVNRTVVAAIWKYIQSKNKKCKPYD